MKTDLLLGFSYDVSHHFYLPFVTPFQKKTSPRIRGEELIGIVSRSKVLKLGKSLRLKVPLPSLENAGREFRPVGLGE